MIIISLIPLRSPSEADSLDSELVARTLAAIDIEEGEVLLIIIIHSKAPHGAVRFPNPLALGKQVSRRTWLLNEYRVVLMVMSNCPIVNFDQVRFEMAIMDYETGMNHNPQVSEIVSDNDDNDDDD